MVLSRKYISFILGFIISGIFLWIIVNNISLDHLKGLILEMNVGYILISIVLFFIAYSLRVERWRLIINNGQTSLKWLNCVGPYFASIAVNNVIPFRAGDFLRAFSFSGRLKIDSSITLASLLIERLLDIVFLLLFLSIALFYFNIGYSRFFSFSGVIILFLGLNIFSIILFPSFFKKKIVCIFFSLRKKYPKFKYFLIKFVLNFFNALDKNLSKNKIFKLFLITFLSWVFEGFVFLFVSFSIPEITNNFASMLAFPVGTFATIIPSTPGYVGTFDYFTSQAMIILGNSSDSSLTFALIVHLILWLPSTLVGGIYLIFNPIKFNNN
jgi:uncharacterized protein (TIRG00374 family)